MKRPARSADYARLPLLFEANRGQTDARVKFVSRGPATVFFTSDQVVLVTPQSARILSLRLAGASPRPQVAGVGEQATKTNYLIGRDPRNWRTGVPTYARVEYREVYPGIDAAFYGNERQLEYDLIVRPGADPGRIALAFQGADRIEVSSSGDLLLHLGDEIVRQTKPVIYQEVDGVRAPVAGGYTLRANGQVEFEVGSYDRALPLVIDPVLLYSTFLGGTGEEFSQKIAVDASGNAYVTGYTKSIDFPTQNPVQAANAGNQDVFVTNLNPTGTGIVYSTYVGGTADESSASIALDASGNAYLCGYTASSDFPVTAGAFDMTFDGLADAFVFKLNATGDTLVYSTYLGGSTDGGDEQANGIAVDASGNAYVGGATRAVGFPTTPGSYQPSLAGFRDIFVTKLNAAGSALVYSTFVGGENFEDLTDIAVDGAGQAYFTGRTFFSFSVVLYPTTTGAFQTTYDGIRDAVVTKLSADGSTLLYSTLLGGTDFDEAFGIAVDSSGNAYVAGWTTSTDFPTAGTPLQGARIGTWDCFISKVNPSGTGLAYSTYLGGNEGGGLDVCRDIAVDSSGNAYVVGQTEATDFPTVAAFQSVSAGSADAFVAKINGAGSALIYSSYLGSPAADDGEGVGLDGLPNPNAYVLGHTASAGFPVTPGVVQPTKSGGQDAFVAKIGDINVPPSVGKVTGGGSTNISGGKATFGFIAQHDNPGDPITGDLQYVNHVTGGKLHSVAFDTFVIVGNTATFGGTCTLNGASCTFTVNIIDNGEPGKDDEFTISINGGTAQGGTLRSGNVKIH